jgi:hypothetical protein
MLCKNQEETLLTSTTQKGAIKRPFLVVEQKGELN